jgi:regulator of nucleoside diphosphate kinase
MEVHMNQQQQLYISQTDRDRLANLIELVRGQRNRSNLTYVRKLEDELEFAEIVAPAEIPADVVTMRSRIRLMDMDSKEESVYSIVFPTEANVDKGAISILTPLATALLGHRSGAIVEFQAPGRVRKLQILEILYQPESAGHLNL